MSRPAILQLARAQRPPPPPIPAPPPPIYLKGRPAFQITHKGKPAGADPIGVPAGALAMVAACFVLLILFAIWPYIFIGVLAVSAVVYCFQAVCEGHSRWSGADNRRYARRKRPITWV